MAKKLYTAEQKQKLVEENRALIKSGLSKEEAAQKLKVPRLNLYRWSRKIKVPRKKIQHDTIVIKEGEPKSFQKIRLLLQLAVDELNNLEH